MKEHHLVKLRSGSFPTAWLTVLAFFVCTQTLLAQAPAPIVAPAPVGSPLVPVGPVANPFGPPPMAIGPAPARNRTIIVGPYGPPMAPPPVVLGPPGAVMLQPPPTPYTTRRATPFDGQPDPQLLAPKSFESRFGPSSPTTLQPPPLVSPANPASVVSMPAPIGNLRLTVSERFLNRLIARDEQRPGDVRDFILGAQVTGQQITATQLRLDLVPSPDKIRGYLVLNGTTNSQTKGVTPQAMIDSASQQQFLATKELLFDGLSFSTRHAVVHVQARTQTLGAMTPLTGTLIGGIADRIAYRAAQRRQPEAEAIARDKVAERVFPEFDTEIDKRLAQANEQLEGTVRRGLRLVNLMPSQQQVSSTDSTLSYSAQIGSETSGPSNPTLTCQLAKEESICLMLHESLLNSLISMSGLKGLKTTDKQIHSYFAPYEVKSSDDDLEKSNPSIAMPGLSNLTTDIEFDESEPLTVRIEQDRALVTLRATFKPGGQAMVPPLVIRLEYKTEIVGNKVIVTPGKARVSAQKGDDGDTVSNMTMSLLSHAIETSLEKLAFDRTLPASFWPFGGAVPGIASIRSENGWAAITIE